MIRILFIIFYLAATYLPVSATPLPDKIRLIVPAFSGPERIGFNASSFLSMQIFKTLRREPTPNPMNLNFGHGEVIWHETELPNQLHIEAERLAKKSRFSAQMILWGKAWPYGGGLIVQAYLSIPRYNDYRDYNHEVWKKFITINNKNFRFQVDIPRRRLMFSPFYLKKDFVNQYASPRSIHMYKLPVIGAQEVGRLGEKFKAFKVENDWAKVRSGKTVGWVQLPTYTRRPVEPIHFSGGMLRLFRADWQGAYAMFEQVLRIPTISKGLKVDALLLQARALEELNMDGGSKLEAAQALSPYSEAVVTYQLMRMISHISELKITKSEQLTSSSMHQIIKLMDKKAYLFPPQDPLISEIRKLMAEMTSK